MTLCSQKSDLAHQKGLFGMMKLNTSNADISDTKFAYNYEVTVASSQGESVPS